MQVGPLSEWGIRPYPSDYGQAFAFCKILYPLAWASRCRETCPPWDVVPRKTADGLTQFTLQHGAGVPARLPAAPKRATEGVPWAPRGDP